MYAIYMLLSFLTTAAVVAVVIGLIPPSIVVRWGTKQTRGRVLLYYGLGFMVLALVADGVKPQDLIAKDKEDLANAPKFTLTATALYKAYETNEVAADNKYKGEIVLVSGTIKNIGKDILDKPYITLDGSGFLGVQCFFEKGKESVLASLSKGQRIKVKGVVSGKFINVQIKDCSLPSAMGNEALAKAPMITLTATALYNAYENNEVAADSKYKGKNVLISGTIKNIGKDILDKPYITLGGSGFLGVQCFFEKSNVDQLMSLSKGQRIKVIGVVSGKVINVQVKDCSLPSAKFTLTADELYNAYETNEVAADNKYKGEFVLISGTIEGMSKNLFGNSYIALETGKMSSNVKCFFEKGKESELAWLSKGERVRVMGVVSGKWASDVHVNDCTVQ